MQIKQILTYIIINISLFLFSQTDYMYVPGSEILQLGLTAPSISLGGAVTTADHHVGFLPVNAAASASLLRYNFLISYTGLSSELNSFCAFLSIPTPLAVFSLGAQVLTSEENELEAFHNYQIVLAKEISTTIKFGITANFDYARNSQSNKTFGGSFDIILLKNSGKMLTKNAGIGNITYGLTAKNIGINPSFSDYKINGTNTHIKPWDFKAGISFDWLNLPIKDTFLQSRYYMDLGLGIFPFNFYGHAGLNISLLLPKAVESISLQFGYLLGYENFGIPNLGPVSFGSSIKINAGKTDFYLHYNLLPESVGDSGIYHTIGLSAAFGMKDTAPPEIIIEGIDSEGQVEIK
jgi:hypothetical protein